MKITALVVGATGLVGNQLLKQLLQDSRFDCVVVFTRRDTGITNSKLQQHIVDFDHPENWKKLLFGDVLYSALGTTLKTAGSKSEQYKVDYTYQYNIAKYAAAQGVRKYVLVSAAGSSPDSKIFYSRMKGELERDIKKLPFETIHILRPGMLEGNREHKRAGEQLGATIMKAVALLPGLGALKPVKGTEVAKAMINLAFKQGEGIHSHGMSAIFRLAIRV
jgi:uncharacterized protein YbjT (DUF2867 family)